MDKFNEEATQRDDLEPDVEFIDEEGFIEHCLDLFDVVRHGSRKQRKRAARELVSLAACAMGELVDVETKLQQTEKELRAFQNAEFPPEENEQSPDKDQGPSPLHLYTPTTETRTSCVINEHAHGDDAHGAESNADVSWAHVDETVDAKLKEEPKV